MNAVLLLGETIAVAISAWLVVRLRAADARDGIEQATAWGVLFVMIIAGSGVLLGATGGLGRGGFAAVQFTTLIALLFVRRRHLPADAQAAGSLARALGTPLGKERAVFYLAVGLGLFLAATGLLAALAEPVVYDALTYRLSRIGHWLQEGGVAHFATNDPRQNYMPVVPDLVMAWLVSAFPAGFPAAALAQWGGGVLLLLATIGLARLAGLSRAAALGAAWLAAGTANVAPQFTTVHTDLLPAGLLAAGCYLWQAAARRGQGSWVAGIGGALALGAKGTVLYLGPTLLLWALWTGWQLRVPLVAWRRTVLATVGAAAVFALPGLVQNWRTYGGPFGPPEFVAMHHQGAGGQLLHKTLLNLGSSFVQVLEPNSQPPGLQAAARAVGAPLTAQLPTRDSLSYENLNRRETLAAIFARQEPDADATSFGLLTLVLFFGGTMLAVFSNRAGSAEIRRWSAGVAVFFIFFHAMQQWHPYAFRYFVLVAPWLAVIAAWGLEAWPGKVGRGAWVLALVATAATAWQVLAHTHQAGWRAATQPERSRNYLVYHGWREWAGRLDEPAAPLQVALPFNRPLAAFYRLSPVRTVHPQVEASLAGLSAEQALAKFGGGWLIVPALQFMGHEGRVRASVWLYDGDPVSPFSVVAYHQLAIGGQLEPITYRHRIVATAHTQRHELLVRPGDAGRITFHCDAVTAAGWSYAIVTPAGTLQGNWPGGVQDISLTLAPDQVSEVVVVFAPYGDYTSDHFPPALDIRP